MSAYYNEVEPYAVQWLRNLIKAGHIAAGDVDSRSIIEVSPDDLTPYTQAHFFAGIGVWSHALRAVGWPDNRPVWTGSCPCQPFSTAGGQLGIEDERHLWPVWERLIIARRPRVVFGEQVEAALAHGWLDTVADDLEGAGYSFAAAGLGAACVGAPHIRARAWFVADDARDGRREERSQPGGRAIGDSAQGRTAGPEFRGTTSELVDTDGARLAQRPGHPVGRRTIRDEGQATAAPGTKSYWDAADLIECSDGKKRAVEPGSFPLAYGVAARVGRLRAYGNAIVSPVAQEFIAAYMECRP